MATAGVYVRDFPGDPTKEWDYPKKPDTYGMFSCHVYPYQWLPSFLCAVTRLLQPYYWPLLLSACFNYS